MPNHRRNRLPDGTYFFAVNLLELVPHQVDGASSIWQRRFWEHTIANDADYATHMDYIHYNPVKHQWVSVIRE